MIERLVREVFRSAITSQGFWTLDFSTCYTLLAGQKLGSGEYWHEQLRRYGAKTNIVQYN